MKVEWILLRLQIERSDLVQIWKNKYGILKSWSWLGRSIVHIRVVYEKTTSPFFFIKLYKSYGDESIVVYDYSLMWNIGFQTSDAGYVWYELVVGSAKMLFLMWCRIMRWLVLGSAKEDCRTCCQAIIVHHHLEYFPKGIWTILSSKLSPI